MKRFKVGPVILKVVLVLVILALLSAGCRSQPADVKVERVGPRAIDETVMVAGALDASSAAQVIPDVYGTVASVMVADGQEVVAGQPLVQLETDNLEQALLSARASLESVQSIAGMFNSLASSAAGIGSSVNSALSTVDAGVEYLIDFQREIIPFLPEEVRLAALQTVENAYAQYQSRAASRPSVSTGGGGGVSTGAQQAAASKSIEIAQQNLADATICAPTGGTLVEVTGGGLSMDSMMTTLMSSFSSMIPSGLDLSSLTGLSSGFSGMGLPSGGPLAPGSIVVPGSPVYSIVNLKDMTMVAKIDETDIARMKTGLAAVVRLEAYPEEEFRGEVVHVANTATTNEAGATAFDVTIELDPVEFDLKMGMTGVGDIVVASKKDALVVPVAALVEKDSKKYVFKVEDGKASLAEVSTGLTTEETVEIIKGVKTGDKVVVKGVEKIKDGQGVKE